MKLHAVLFTYSLDAPLAAFAYDALTKQGVSVTVAWDIVAPSPHAIKRMPLAKHIVTTFKRHKNLNGLNCLKGILNLLASEGEAAGAHFVIKVDSDTIVRPLFIAHLEKSRLDAEGVNADSAKKRLWWGACYALKPKAARKLLEMACVPGGVKCRPIGEDEAIGELLHKSTLRRGVKAELGFATYGNPPRNYAGRHAMHYALTKEFADTLPSVPARKAFVAQLMSGDESLQ